MFSNKIIPNSIETETENKQMGNSSVLSQESLKKYVSNKLIPVS